MGTGLVHSGKLTVAVKALASYRAETSQENYKNAKGAPSGPEVHLKSQQWVLSY